MKFVIPVRGKIVHAFKESPVHWLVLLSERCLIVVLFVELVCAGRPGPSPWSVVLAD